MRLFVYGTLRDPARQERVTGRRFPARPARLRDYARRDAAYPYVIPSPGDVVDGLLLDDVDADALARLDVYEDAGHLYARRSVTVEVGDARVDCEIYVGLGIAR